jgi:hypothetical protein
LAIGQWEQVRRAEAVAAFLYVNFNHMTVTVTVAVIV